MGTLVVRDQGGKEKETVLSGLPPELIKTSCGNVGNC